MKHPSHAFPWSHSSSHLLYSKCSRAFFPTSHGSFCPAEPAAGGCRSCRLISGQQPRSFSSGAGVIEKPSIPRCLPAHGALGGPSPKTLSLGIYAALPRAVPVRGPSHAPAAAALHGDAPGAPTAALPIPCPALPERAEAGAGDRGSCCRSLVLPPRRWLLTSISKGSFAGRGEWRKNRCVSPCSPSKRPLLPVSFSPRLGQHT